MKAVDDLFKFGVSQATPRHQAPRTKLVESIMHDAASTTRVIKVPKDFFSDCSSDSSYQPSPKKLKVSLHCSSAVRSRKQKGQGLGRLISGQHLNAKYMTRSKSKKIFKETGKMPPMLELASSSSEDSPCKDRYCLRSHAPNSTRPLYELKEESPKLEAISPKKESIIRFGFEEGASPLDLSPAS